MNIKLNFIIVALFMCCSLSVRAYDASVDTKLEGTPISRSSASGAIKAFDGDVTTYFNAGTADMQWVGLDLGSQHVITRIIYRPRSGGNGSDRMLLSVFEGANSPDFMDAVPLYLIGERPASGYNTAVDVNVSRGFRYVRYVGSAGSYANVAELEFHGHAGAGDDSRFYQVTALPTMSIHVRDNAVPQTKGQDFDSRITITYENGTLIQEYPVLTRVRGNFSATHENKPYRVKFNDGKSHHMLKGSPRDESPAKCKKWVLINNFGDKTLIRNNIAFEVSRRVGMPFTPYCRNVDLILNGDYRGTYQLTDYVGLDKNRINIAEMDETNTDPETITGGYLFEMNGYAGGDPKNFTSKRGNPISIKDPDDDVLQDIQFDYIKNYFNDMEARVYSSNYTDPEKGYRPMLDVESFLKYFLANEFSGNTDMLWQVFMYKDRGDSLIYTGPVWDNDLALENDHNVYPGNEREDWTYTVRCAGKWSNFVGRVLSDPYAMNRLRDMWAELRDDSVFTSDNIVAYVDSLRALVSASQRLNHLRWPYLLQQVHCNPAVWGSWDAEVDNVCRYVSGRVTWMDRKLSYGTLPIKNGIYQISSARDMYMFSQMVNGGERGADACLITDIDMTDYADKFESIGQLNNTYTGHFDGQGHVISGLKLSGRNYVGLFGSVSSGAKISNLRLGADCTVQGSSYVAALVGQVRSGELTITGCGNEAQVTASGSAAAAFVGYMRATTKVTVKDSYNVGQVQATSQAAAMVGHCAGTLTISNSYNAGAITGCTPDMEFAHTQSGLNAENCYDIASSQVNKTNLQDVENGKLCYDLNVYSNSQTWRQNIDNGRPRDTHPLPLANHGMVYQDGTNYTNYNPDFTGYRYYLLSITEIAKDNVIQLSEFDLLDQDMEEVENLDIYSYTGEHFNNEEQENLVDNNVNTKYCGIFDNGVYLYFDAGETIVPYGYRLYTANDTGNSPGRNPISWKLYGSDAKLESPDAAGWILLDERQADRTLEAVNYTPFDFMLDLRPNGNSIENIMQQNEEDGLGIFDLSGRRISRNRVGQQGKNVYIIGGKKILK